MQRNSLVLVSGAVFIATSLSALAQTPGTIAKFSASGDLDDSLIVQNGGNIGIGTAPDPVVTLLVNNPAGHAVIGTSTDASGVQGIGNRIGVVGNARATSGFAAGLFGTALENPDGAGVNGLGSRVGVFGEAEGTSGFAAGLAGTAVATPDGTGVNGIGSRTGVYGEARGTSGSAAGLFGTAVAAPDGSGVSGIGNRTGVYGEARGTNGFAAGLFGTAIGTPDGNGVQGIGNQNGVFGQSTSGTGVSGSSVSGMGVYGESSSGLAGFFNGNTGVAGDFNISGTLSKGGGMFKIDHPLDPANKYLSHSFVESPDMKNIYDGTVTTDVRGYATVTLPRYFDALNSDFRYQLTVVGQFAQAIVASEIQNNRFTIRTSVGNVKVSWQVTGIRKDAYANAHRIKVEEDKAFADRGRYLHPEVFSHPREKAIGMHNVPEMTAARSRSWSATSTPAYLPTARELSHSSLDR